jgi:glycosyltransferase involved in cell wall biosynthesis
MPVARVLILVENLSVPSDRRVWQECLALRAAGYDVTVICPAGAKRDTALHERREGVDIHRFRLEPASGGPVGYIREYATACFRTRRIALRLHAAKPFDIVQACNPPDLLLPAVRRLKRRGARFVFDHHDLVPELYLSRFARGRDVFFRGACACERLTFRLADVVISTNESYRDVAIERGRKRREDVFVVRNAPDPRRFRPVEPDPRLKQGRPFLLAYVGVIAPQDGVDLALHALATLRESRDDWHAVFLGDGDALEDMRALACRLELQSAVEFAGWGEDEQIVRLLQTADVCIAPDPRSPLNDKSTMIKVAEYMAMSKPIVAFDLPETLVTAGDAALFAVGNDHRAFAARIGELLDAPALRARLGRLGRSRVEGSLAWRHSEAALLAAYARALSAPAANAAALSSSAAEPA